MLIKHSRCLPHRLHIAVSAMIKKCTGIATEEGALNPDSRITTAIGLQITTHSQALAQDPWAKLQYIGNEVRLSQLKRHNFKRMIARANQRRSATAEAHLRRQGLNLASADASLPPELRPLPDLILYRQVVNRWGSGLMMLGRGLYLREVSHANLYLFFLLIFIFQPVDIYSQLYLDPKYHISQLEWEVLQDIYDILEVRILFVTLEDIY